MRVAVSAPFQRFRKKERISDATLRRVVSEIESGLVDAEIGEYLYKKRLPRPGQGKRGGYRAIIVLVRGDKALFLFGYAKNEKSDLSEYELQNYRQAAPELAALAFDDLLEAGFKEIMPDDGS